MKSLDAYTPAQIRACGMMLQFAGTESIISLAAQMKAQATNPVIRRFRLYVPSNLGSVSNEDFLLAVGLQGLKDYQKIAKLFNEREITDNEIRKIKKKLRSADWNQTHWGRLKK